MKKLFAVIVCCFLIIETIPLQAYAGEKKTDVVYDKSDKMVAPTGSESKEPSDAELETAIKKVKSKVEIPSTYTEFNYYFNTPYSYADPYWQLIWRNPKDNSFLQVNCDSSYHITGYSKNDYSEKTSYLPKYLKKELEQTAFLFIKQIAPDIYQKLEYVDAAFLGIYNGGYQYSYQRKENGIAFPDNYVNVTVDCVSGKVISADICWLYDVKVPDSTTKVTLDQATSTMKKNLEMKLTYETDYYHIFYDDSKELKAQRAFLVYQPDKTYLSVDAKTGKLYDTRYQTVIKPGDGADTKYALDESSKEATGNGGLTDKEAAEVEELKNLISKDDAIKAVTGNKYLLLDKNLKKINANLSKYSYDTGKETYVWNIEMSDPRKIDYDKEKDPYRAYASAQVDAKTGKIIYFYASIKDNYNSETGKWDKVKIKYDKDACQKVLEKLLKSEVYNYYVNSKFTAKTDSYVAYYKGDQPVYGGFDYQYNRVNEGVEYSYNGIYGSVDGVSGKVYSFRYNWDDSIKFESTKGAMSKEKALDSYLKQDGYHLVYEINQTDTYDTKQADKEYVTDDVTTKYEIRLVYRTDITPSYISPFTGEKLNYDGTAYSKTKPYTYVDVENNDANRPILLLADMNIGFEGDHFNPNSNISIGEISKLFEGMGYGSGYGIEENESKDKLITREEIAYRFIKYLGLEKLSSLEGIYSTGFNDQSSINRKYIGAVSLAKGLGLMNGDSSNNFNPQKYITRYEAVTLILNYIKVQSEGVY